MSSSDVARLRPKTRQRQIGDLRKLAMKSVLMNQAEADRKLLGLEMVSMLVGDEKVALRGRVS